jgi:hypothetical protein
VRKEDIIEYANRWGPIAKSKRRRVAESTLTPFEKLSLAGALREHALFLHPDWPTEKQRREDHENHIRLIEALRSVKPPRHR